MDTDKIKFSSNKSFGILFFVLFMIISLYPLLKGGNIKILTIIPAIIFLILGLLNSPVLKPLNKIWFKFGILLGSFISPIVMGVIFFIVITPISIIMKILDKNLLGLNKNKKKSYWVKRSLIKSKMKNQF
jgi:hypothetical protein